VPRARADVGDAVVEAKVLAPAGVLDLEVMWDDRLQIGQQPAGALATLTAARPGRRRRAHPDEERSDQDDRPECRSPHAGSRHVLAPFPGRSNERSA
jgi:hypothetical protein